MTIATRVKFGAASFSVSNNLPYIENSAPELAAGLVQLQVAVIIVPGLHATLAAKAATTTIPILFSVGADPVPIGLVASLNRPGGNLTGFNVFSGELGAKGLALLHELVPTASMIGFKAWGMQRRDFITAVGLVAVWPLAAQAQQPNRLPRIGFLATGSLELPATRASLNAFRQGLRELGYFDGQNIVIEVRAADSKVERFPALASELIGLKVDVIVALNSLSGRAAKQATTTIPIVVPVMGDPVEDGLVASLARPGGNVTGLTFLGPQLVPKRLALLKEALSSAYQVAALWHPRAYGERTMNDVMKETESAGLSLGLHLRFVAVHGPDQLDQAFSTIAAERTDAVMVFPSPMLFNERGRIVDLAGKLRLPLISMGKEFVELGRLI
jgi:putative tryptophan/tyrosine transport system substrate-binding protein